MTSRVQRSVTGLSQTHRHTVTETFTLCRQCVTFKLATLTHNPVNSSQPAYLCWLPLLTTLLHALYVLPTPICCQPNCLAWFQRCCPGPQFGTHSLLTFAHVRHHQSRTGCKFLTGQGVQEGAAPLCRNDFFLSLL